MLQSPPNNLMGGSAFVQSHPQILFRPLTGEESSKLSELLPSLVSDHFKGIKVPIPAFEMPNDSEIDVIVHSPRTKKLQFESLTAVFQAIAHVSDGKVHSFAVPLAFLLNGHDTGKVEASSGKDHPSDPPICCQVNVESCQAGIFDWKVKIHSYGGLWLIVGMMLTRFGLAITDSGLLLLFRLSDESQINVTRSDHRKLLLTSNSPKIMEYLNLDHEEYLKGFATLETVFRWVVHCRFFSREPFLPEESGRGIAGGSQTDRLASKRSIVEALLKKEQWMVAQFTDWLQCSDGVTGTISQVQPHKSMHPTFNEALHSFGKHDEYQKMVEEHREQMRVNDVWSSVAVTLNLPDKALGEVMERLKHAVALKLSPKGLRAAMSGILRRYLAPAGSVDDSRFRLILQKLSELKNVPTAP